MGSSTGGAEAQQVSQTQSAECQESGLEKRTSRLERLKRSRGTIHRDYLGWLWWWDFQVTDSRCLLQGPHSRWPDSSRDSLKHLLIYRTKMNPRFQTFPSRNETDLRFRRIYERKSMKFINL